MNDSPATRPSLLIRARDTNDQEAWRELADLYGPLLYAYARHKGLQDSDAADLSQEVLAILADRLSEFAYDPTRGSFRGWLFTVTRNRLRNWASRQPLAARGTGESEVAALLAELPERSEQNDFDHLYHWQQFLWAVEQVQVDFREQTFEAFRASVIEGHAPKAVAERLEITVGAVYIAKSRVLARVRECLEQAGLD
jgi:RNA polymerase sigma-70 factor (ECF subfamily)